MYRFSVLSYCCIATLLFLLRFNINRSTTLKRRPCCCCCRPHSTNVLPAESSTRIMWQPTVSPPRWQGKAPLCRDSSRCPGLKGRLVGICTQIRGRRCDRETERRMQPARGRFARFDLDRQMASTFPAHWKVGPAPVFWASQPLEPAEWLALLILKAGDVENGDPLRACDKLGKERRIFCSVRLKYKNSFQPRIITHWINFPPSLTTRR